MGNKYFYTYIQNDEFREGRVVAGERSMTTIVEEKTTTRHKTDIYKKKKKKKRTNTHTNYNRSRIRIKQSFQDQANNFFININIKVET